MIGCKILRSLLSYTELTITSETIVCWYQGEPIQQKIWVHESGDWPLEFCMLIGRLEDIPEKFSESNNHHAELQWPVTAFCVPIFL